jgi:putative transposase
MIPIIGRHFLLIQTKYLYSCFGSVDFCEALCFLAVVLDMFSRMVLGWSMATLQDAAIVTQALHMALARRRPQAGLLHHSDRGSTYTSESYQVLLQQKEMQVSMSRTADCYDNTAMESVRR